MERADVMTATELFDLMAAADSLLEHFEPDTPEWQTVNDLAAAVLTAATVKVQP